MDIYECSSRTKAYSGVTSAPESEASPATGATAIGKVARVLLGDVARAAR